MMEEKPWTRAQGAHRFVTLVAERQDRTTGLEEMPRETAENNHYAGGNEGGESLAFEEVKLGNEPRSRTGVQERRGGMLNPVASRMSRHQTGDGCVY